MKSIKNYYLFQPFWLNLSDFELLRLNLTNFWYILNDSIESESYLIEFLAISDDKFGSKIQLKSDIIMKCFENLAQVDSIA